MKKPPERTRGTAEALAIQALTFLAGVLEHMLGDESLLIAFATSAGIDPAEVARARAAMGRRWERDVP